MVEKGSVIDGLLVFFALILLRLSERTLLVVDSWLSIVDRLVICDSWLDVISSCGLIKASIVIRRSSLLVN